MAMAVMTVPMVTMAVPVVPVMAVATSESLTRDSQRRRGQRQSSDSGGNDLLMLVMEVSWLCNGGIALQCSNRRGADCDAM